MKFRVVWDVLPRSQVNGAAHPRRLKEISAVYSENHTKPTNTICGKNSVILVIKVGGTYSNHWALWLSLSAMKVPREGKYSFYTFLNSTLDGVSGQRNAPAALYSRERTTRYPLDSRLSGPKSWCGHRG
jgi:hypothetical protein